LQRWIKEGAHWDDHWAYRPLQLELQNQQEFGQQHTGIDYFVVNNLNNSELGMNDQAEPAALVRRVSLDLTGLPPTTELAQRYLQNPTAEAYEALVDSLLASPHFGERWASMWLDLARYADSQGYQKDNLRPTMWMYRDWVIDAFNQDMPFDQFTIEQLAGDLIPEATENQLLATAFHRNTMSNDEGGTDDEEFRVMAVLDRANTTFEVWQATTLSCVQCHTHPYDPIRHKEFYEVYAFFNNTADRDLTSDAPRKLLLSKPQLSRKLTSSNKIQILKNQNDTISASYAKAVKELLDIRPLSVPVMQELSADSARLSHVFERGNWLVHGEQVAPQVPQALNYMGAAPSDRLELAQWLVDSENPLTARVMVNRFWEQLFGIGLVETLEDFGTQGEPPSHPQLLDWLSLQFMHQHQWSVKKLLRQIVLSKTYRQSSEVSPELLALDPYNKLLGRGPRVRLSAEQIRDQALMVSGLLNPEVYGPSVMPYQPDGVWNVIRHVGRWQMATEPKNRYRRALYTFWRRVSPYPSMITFDTPSREFCVSRRIRTNTPLQALVTLNDPVYVEAAQALAENMMESSENLSDQITFGYQQALYRGPQPSELTTLTELYQQAINEYQHHQTSEQRELAALTQLATVILNLDEFITKG